MKKWLLFLFKHSRREKYTLTYIHSRSRLPAACPLAAICGPSSPHPPAPPPTGRGTRRWSPEPPDLQNHRTKHTFTVDITPKFRHSDSLFNTMKETTYRKRQGQYFRFKTIKMLKKKYLGYLHCNHISDISEKCQKVMVVKKKKKVFKCFIFIRKTDACF